MICTIRCKPKAIKQQYQAVKSFMQIDITVQADIIINSSNTVKAKTGALLKESTLSFIKGKRMYNIALFLSNHVGSIIISSNS